MLKLPTQTLGAEYIHVFSEDPAIDRPHPTGDTDADQKNLEAFVDIFQRAIETGDFSTVPLKKGQAPSQITLRRFSGRKRQQFADLFSRVYGSDGKFRDGANAAIYDLVRAALVKIGDMDLATEHDPDWGDVLTEDALGKLSLIPGLFSELHGRIIMESSLASKKK